MPIRRFHCKKCGNTIEMLRLPQEETLKEKPCCPLCKSKKLQQLPTAANFKFERGGFSASSINISPTTKDEMDHLPELPGNLDVDLGTT